VQVVVPDVVATVPVERVVRIADAGRTGRVDRWRSGAGKHERKQRDGGEEREAPGHGPSPTGLTVPLRVHALPACATVCPVAARTLLPPRQRVTLQFSDMRRLARTPGRIEMAYDEQLAER